MQQKLLVSLLVAVVSCRYMFVLARSVFVVCFFFCFLFCCCISTNSLPPLPLSLAMCVFCIHLMRCIDTMNCTILFEGYTLIRKMCALMYWIRSLLCYCCCCCGCCCVKLAYCAKWMRINCSSSSFVEHRGGRRGGCRYGVQQIDQSKIVAFSQIRAGWMNFNGIWLSLNTTTTHTSIVVTAQRRHLVAQLVWLLFAWIDKNRTLATGSRRRLSNVCLRSE